MTVLVDARPLVDPLQGGVTRVATGLLHALALAMPRDRFVWATVGHRRLPFPDKLPTNVEARHFWLPNKIGNGLMSAGFLSFEKYFGEARADLLFLPNLGFAGRPRLPYVLLVHDLSFLIEPSWFSRKAHWWHKAVHAQRLIQEATHLLAVSGRTKTDLIERLAIPQERITVIPLGLPGLNSSPSPLPYPLTARRFFLLLDISNARKNAACVLAAFKTLIQNPLFADVILVTTGDHSRNRRSSVDDRHCLPLQHPNDAALAALMKNATALLYPSWYEGFGLPLHEAAKFYTPCIASTAGALPETAPSGTFFAPPFKPHLWTQVMKEVLAAPDHFITQTPLGDWSAAGKTVREIISDLHRPISGSG